MVATEVRHRRGTNSQHNSFTGAQGEFTFSTDDKHIRAHDGVTAGGIILPNAPDVVRNRFNSGTAGGTADALTLTVTPAVIAYVDKQIFYVEIASNNTGSATLQVSGLASPKTIKKNSGADNLEADDLVAGAIVPMIFDGTVFQILGNAGGSAKFTKEYISPKQVITSAGALTLGHSLTVIPKSLEIWARCENSSVNYSPGDQVLLSIDPSTSNGISVVPDATNLNIRYGSVAQVIRLTNKNSGSSANPSNSDWRIIFKAWA